MTLIEIFAYQTAKDVGIVVVRHLSTPTLKRFCCAFEEIKLSDRTAFDKYS